MICLYNSTSVDFVSACLVMVIWQCNFDGVKYFAMNMYEQNELFVKQS